MSAADSLPLEEGAEDSLAVPFAEREVADDAEQTASMHAPLVAGFRLTVLLAWILFFVPVVAIPTSLGLVRLARATARIFWRGTRCLLGLKIVCRGRPGGERPLLVVANHASYLDIIVLGSLIEAAFVAKKEVGQWPGIGLMSRIGRTVFIDRLPRHSQTQKNEMLARLDEVGESLILFPEGTSNDGNRVLPFKSALLAVAELQRRDGSGLPVQPVSIAYTRLDGLPIGRSWRPFFAWYGDMEMAPHLWMMLGLGHITAEVQFHPVVRLEQFGSRKALADHCHRMVRGGVEAANHGRASSPI